MSFTLGEHEYKFSIDAFVLGDLRDNEGIDLANPQSEDFARLAFDEVVLVKTLWATCRESAPAGQDGKAFARLVVGDKLQEGREALEKALLSFFPSWKRRILKMQLEGFETLRRRTAEETEKINVEEIAEQALTESRSASGSQGSLGLVRRA